MRKILITTFLLGLLGIGGVLGYQSYRGFRQRHFLSQAETFISRADYTNALLVLQRALQAKSDDVVACRLMAGLAESGRSPDALALRQRIVKLHPESLRDRLALVKTALMLNDIETAENALKGADQAGRNTAGYRNLAGTVALARQRFDEAETNFVEAVRLAPQDSTFQLNLDLVRLRHTDPQIVAQARRSLEQLRTIPAVRCDALRELTADAIRSGQTNVALTLSQELLLNADSLFQDRMLRLNVLRFAHRPEFDSFLAGLQEEATNSSSSLHDLASWQLSAGLASNALNWLSSLPVSTRTNQPVALLLVGCHAELQQWTQLKDSIEAQNWGELEFFRLAYRSLSLRQLGMAAAAKTEWGRAMQSVEGRRERLVALLQLATLWNRSTETEDILWAIVNRYPAEKWAFRSLARKLYTSGQTRSLMKLSSQRLANSPEDADAKNDLATTALLLQAMEQRPNDLAQEIYKANPANPYYAATYAFSLYLQDKKHEALTIMDALKAADLEIPAVSGYYAVILKGAGSGDRAKKYWDISFRTILLPEERKLFEQAQSLE
jgi:tetratricopeptide (TPR) repeat protein